MSILEFEPRGRWESEDTPTREPLWTVKDVAAYLRLKRETVRVMARSGKLPAIKVGKLWRFTPDDMRNYMACQACAKEQQEG